MTDLLELAATVEELTGPDREVDGRIGMAIGLKNTMRVGHECLGTDRVVPVRCPAYTASLDAAWSLIPHGFKVREFEQDSGHDWQWWCWLTTETAEGNGSSMHAPQLALVAAALRARAHGGGEG